MGKQLAFGGGALFGTRNDVGGSTIGPVQFGVLQSVDLDFSFTTKELWGQDQWPEAVARGQGKITGKAMFAEIYSRVYSDLFAGVTPAAGTILLANGEINAIPATTPYTVAVANASEYDLDCGVIYAGGANAGQRFAPVATPASAGEYSVNTATGVYTFSAADAGASVAITYTYRSPSTGMTVNVTNQPAGTTPTFSLVAWDNFQAPQRLIKLYNCTSEKLTMPQKIDEWSIEELDFAAFSSASGQVYTLYTAN